MRRAKHLEKKLDDDDEHGMSATVLPPKRKRGRPKRTPGFKQAGTITAPDFPPMLACNCGGSLTPLRNDPHPLAFRDDYRLAWRLVYDCQTCGALTAMIQRDDRLGNALLRRWAERGPRREIALPYRQAAGYGRR